MLFLTFNVAPSSTLNVQVTKSIVKSSTVNVQPDAILQSLVTYKFPLTSASFLTIILSTLKSPK